jgi:hypothetical protein
MPLLVLLALLVTPYGRMQAQAATAHPAAPMATAGHCEPAPAKTPTPPHHGSIDCMIACAGIPSVESALAGSPLPPVAAMIAPPAEMLHGILPQFDPPPPRSHS